MSAREVLDGIKARLEFPVENLNFIEQAAAENQLLRVDLPRLTAAVDAALTVADEFDAKAGHRWASSRLRAAIENAIKEQS